jgi:hypothetical protein
MNDQEVKTLTVPVATYVAEECRRIAEILGVSVDALCAYFFASGVVHT